MGAHCSQTFRMSRLRKFLLAVGTAAVVLGGCMTPPEALKMSDEAASGIVAEKQKTLFGDSRPFDVVRPEGREHPASIDAATGLASRPAPLKLSRGNILEYAARNSREFQTERERLYRAALALASEREDFTFHPFARVGTDVKEAAGVDSVSGNTQIGTTRLLERGGSFLLFAGASFLTFGSGGASTTSSLLGMNLSLPLFRNAGEDVAMENLRQADRNALYALRDFERYKQRFSVDVEVRFLRLLSLARQVGNEERNLQRLRETRERNEALAEAQRLTEIQVDQARQNELDAQSRVLLSKNRFQSAQDEFKRILGVPVDLLIDVDPNELADLEPLMARGAPVPDTVAMRQGLRLRLDLQNVRDDLTDAMRQITLAENALEPDLRLDLLGEVPNAPGSTFRPRFEDGVYRAGISGDLGLYRDSEAFSLRSAHLDRESAARAIEGYEDVVKTEIRLAMRNLEQGRINYDIQKNAVAVAARRVESVNEFILRGDAATRDLLEAQSSLVRAENSLSDAIVEYRNSFLSFYRDTGALVLRPEGLDHETSDALLQAP